MTNISGAQCTQTGMGTVMMHKAFGRHADACLKAVQVEARRLEDLLSRFIPGSDISRINRSAGKQAELVESDTFEVLSQAQTISANLREYFAVTIAPLVDLWCNSRAASRSPEDADIRTALLLVDDDTLLTDPVRQTVGLNKVGQSIDLGGIAKGYAGDRFVQIYREYGVSSAYSNIGGNVVTVGNRPDGSPWQIGIQHPRCEDCLLGVVSVNQKTVVTSGDYQRFFTDGLGRRHHHILDPLTGYPSASGLTSVTVVADSSLMADALSTILFVAGLHKGLDILREYPGVEAVLVDGDMLVYVTEGLKGNIEFADDAIVMVVEK